MEQSFGPHLRRALQAYDRLGGSNSPSYQEAPRLRDIYDRCVKGNVIDMTMPLLSAASLRKNMMNERGEIVSRINYDNLPNFPYT